MRDFANRLWGISFTLWFIAWSNSFMAAKRNAYFDIPALLVFVYFCTFGTSRFEKPYKKII